MFTEFENPFEKLMLGYWAWEGTKKAAGWTVESLILGNLGFILPAAWVVGLFLFKSTKPYAIGATGLWVLFQL